MSKRTYISTIAQKLKSNHLGVARMGTPARMVLLGLASLSAIGLLAVFVNAGQHASLMENPNASPASTVDASLPDKASAVSETPQSVDTQGSDSNSTSSNINIDNHTIEVPANGSVHATTNDDDSNSQVDISASNSTSTNSTSNTRTTSRLRIKSSSSSETLSTQINSGSTNTSD